ncbi:hypothetical protein ACFE04_009259 [Oxalis oulophora]
MNNCGPFDLKRKWQHERRPNITTKIFNNHFLNINPNSNLNNKLDEDLVSTVVPPVTVVLEGRSICQRVSLHKHSSYHSLAKALRQMFVDGGSCTLMNENDNNNNQVLDLCNAIPGYLIAYEDMENDLLLAGDLNWK